MDEKEIVDKSIKDIWLFFLLRGITAVIFGILIAVYPDVTVKLFIVFFGIFLLVDGIFGVFRGFLEKGNDKNWWVTTLGGLGVFALGIITLTWPKLSAVALLYMVGIYALMIGILAIIYGFQILKKSAGGWIAIILGVLSAGFGIYTFVNPGDGAVTLIWLISAYTIFVGIVMMILSFIVKKFGNELMEEIDAIEE